MVATRINGTRRFTAPKDTRSVSQLLGMNFARPPSGEAGYGGLAHYGDYYDDAEWNAKLKGPEGLKRRRQMFYRHHSMHAAYQAVTLPLCGVDYTVTAPSDSPRDREIAEFVQRQLENIRGGWDAFCDEAWDVLVYGHYAFEKVWRTDGDSVILDALAARPPTSVERLLPDERGELAGIVQWKFSGSGQMGEVRIPREKLLFMVRKKRGNNWAGIGLGEAAHMAWSILMELYMMHGIAIEKRNMGVDTMALAEGDPNSDETKALMTKALTALRGLHNREQQGMAVPPGMTYALHGISGGVIDAMPYIEHLERGCLQSMLADFVAVGSGDGGSYAMVRDKSSFFTQSLKAHARLLTGAMTEQVIAPLVAFNYPDVTREEYPYLDHGPLDTRNVKDLGEALAKFVQTGAVPVDMTTREYADSLLGIVDRPEPEDVEPPDEPMPKPDPVTPDGDDQTDDGDTVNAANLALFDAAEGKGLKSARHPVVRHVDFAGMNEAMDDGAERIVEAMKAAQDKQVAALIRHAKRNFGGPISKLTNPRIPKQKEVAASIATILRELFDRGRAEVGREMQLQGMTFAHAFADDEPDADDPEATDDYITSKADLLAKLAALSLLSTYALEVTGMKRQGVLDVDRLETTLGTLALQSARKAANSTVAEAMALGRQTEQKALEDAGQVGKVLYSAIGDGETCPNCNEADGAEFDSLEDMVDAQAYPPLLNSEWGTCEGTGACRCDAITVFQERDV